MRIKQAFFAITFLISAIDSISQFKEIYPTRDRFLDVQVVSPSQAYVVGTDYTRGSIYKTTNAGVKWTRVSVPDSINPSGSFISSSFINPDTGFVLSWEQARILRTTNGGGSWTSQLLDLSVDKGAQIKFVNPTTGFVRTEKGKIFKTTDGGNTWSPIPIPVQNAQGSSGFFINDQVFFVVYDGVLYKTMNSGATWLGPILFSRFNVSYTYFHNVDTGYAVASTEVWKTYNGGNSWFVLYDMWHGGPYPICMSFYDVQRGFWFSTFLEPILYTTNASLAFTQRFTSHHGFVWYNADVKGSFGCGIAQNSSLVTSSDSGQTWTIRNIIPQLGELRDIAFPTDTSGLVIGDFWGVFRTKDKAQTWYMEEESINIDNKYMMEFTPAKDTGLIEIGGSDTYITTNKGDSFIVNPNWQRPFAGHFSTRDYFLFNSKEIFGVGLRIDTPVIVHSTNGGMSWQRFYPPSTSQLNAINFPSWNVGYACGNDGKIWKTSNHGSSWTQQSTPVTNQLNGLYFLDSLTGFAFGEVNTVLRTTNGGITWTQSQSPLVGSIRTMHFINESIGFCFNHSGSFAVTANRGASWASLNIPGGNMSLDKIVIRADTSAFALGDKRIYALDLKPFMPLITSVPSISQQGIDIKIFPNPAAEWLFVKLEKPLRINRVSIYDMTGRLIRNYLFNGTSVSSFQKNIVDLSKGVYLLIITDRNNKRYAKRFVKK